jgi:hypothetical protein
MTSRDERQKYSRRSLLMPKLQGELMGVHRIGSRISAAQLRNHCVSRLSKVYLEIIIDRKVAVQPSNNNSLTYGFLHTSSINPGSRRERMTRSAVAQYVLITLTRRDVRNVKMIIVMRSPKEDANGVAMLSSISANKI